MIDSTLREDRVEQVVGLKLQLKGAVGFAQPGRPMATFRLAGLI